MPGRFHTRKRKARSRRQSPLSHERSIWRARERRRPRQKPERNKRKLEREADNRRRSAGMPAVEKAIPTRTLSKERARLKSSASFALKICRSVRLASSGDK